MKTVIISDTHGAHESLDLAEGDLLIHCGDWSARSTEQDTIDFAKWFKKQPFQYKVCVAGNHDRFASTQYFQDSLGGENCFYLQDSHVVIEGFKIYGMPWTPTFFDWYWMKDRGAEMEERTDRIPLDTDILVTHGPERGSRDYTLDQEYAGCGDLSERLTKIEPLMHCFGHIHEGYGYDPFPDSLWHIVNASIMNTRYQPVNKPIEIEL